MSVDVKKSLTDAGYILVGLGVLGVQQVNTRVHDLRERVLGAGCVGESATRARERLENLGDEVRGRLEPVVGQVQDRLPEPVAKLPDLPRVPDVTKIRSQVGRAVESGTDRVRAIAGSRNGES